MTIRTLLVAFCCVTLPLFSATAFSDEVRFDGQNALVGELRRLERGELYFETPATDTIAVKWNHVDSINSSKQLEIELSDGQLYYGTPDTADAKRHVRIRQDQGPLVLPMADIVRMTEIEDVFLDRFDATVDAGINFHQVTH
jgi:hypothetical protein